MADLAQLLAQFEGFYKPGSRAQRNNNPGNLRAGPRAVGKDAAGYAVYASADDGWADLNDQIARDAGRGQTVESFIYGYAPPSDNNNTQNYLNFLLSRLGVPGTTLLSDLGTGSPPVNPSPGLQGTSPSGGPGTAPRTPEEDC